MRLVACCLFVACVPRDRPGFGLPGPPAPPRCPEDMVEVQGGGHALGEWDEDLVARWGDNIIPVDDFAIESFCVQPYPFPGSLGDAWPLDGLRYDQVAALEEALAAYGRRPCTITELAYAAAGKANWRYPWDAEEDALDVCDPDDANPQPMGTYIGCASPFGVSDFQVRSTWGVLDEDMADVVRDQRADGLPDEHDYAVWGGTSRRDTYYAPTNFGIHFRERDSKAYTDDGFRVCADRFPYGEEAPGEREEAWRAWLQAFRTTGSFAAFLGE